MADSDGIFVANYEVVQILKKLGSMGSIINESDTSKITNEEKKKLYDVLSYVKDQATYNLLTVPHYRFNFTGNDGVETYVSIPSDIFESFNIQDTSTQPDNAATTDIKDKATNEPQSGKSFTPDANANVSELKNKAQQQRVPEELDNLDVAGTSRAKQNIYNGTTPEQISEKDYVSFLCQYANTQTRADIRKPQIPVSVIVSISLVRCKYDSTDKLDPKAIGQYNYWALPYDKTLTKMEPDTQGNCCFETAAQGINAILNYLRKDQFKDVLKGLEEKMSDNTEEQKEATIKQILTIIGVLDWQDSLAAAKKHISKYDLFRWDKDVIKAEGGHSDETISPNEKGESDNPIIAHVSKALKNAAVDSLKQMYGNGVQIIPIGTKYVKIIKLPKGKTPCEPIYPDLITVGDYVPSWLFSQEYVEAYKAAEEAALKAAGFDIEEDNIKKQITLFNTQLNKFIEQQYNTWCTVNEIEDPDSDEAKQQYREAATEDTENFVDGIYLPDISAKNTYQAFLNKKRAILERSPYANTMYTHSKYVEDLTKVKQDITNREGNWNQEQGVYIPTNNSTINLGTGPSTGGLTTGAGQGNVTYTTVEATGFKGMGGAGYGTYWIGQTGAVSWAGAQPQTLDAMDILGQWFYSKTGHPLVMTAVTNGNHAAGTHSHGAGWKFDCNDYGSGAEGTLTTDNYGKGTLTDEFLQFGTSIGLGMNWEAPGTVNVHIDISAWGDQWADFNGNTLSSTVNHGGLRYK